MIFLKIKWYFDLLSYARNHAEEVDNYKFLISIRKDIHDKLLELERTNPEHTDIFQLKIQVDLIDKILNYVDKR